LGSKIEEKVLENDVGKFIQKYFRLFHEKSHVTNFEDT